jgi:flagellar motility protein MotE (MotC chaperone)
MKTKLLYVLPFVLAFAVITGILMYLNSAYQNIFGFDFSPTSNLQSNADLTKIGTSDSLKTHSSNEETLPLDSLKTDSVYAKNLKDSVRTELYIDGKTGTTNLAEQKNAADINNKKQQSLITGTKSQNLDSLKNGADKQYTYNNKTLKDTTYASWIKNVTSIYEAMEPKKAAKIIQNYSDNVARDILYTMKKKTAAKIVAELNPEVANRIFRFE